MHYMARELFEHHLPIVDRVAFRRRFSLLEFHTNVKYFFSYRFLARTFTLDSLLITIRRRHSRNYYYRFIAIRRPGVISIIEIHLGLVDISRGRRYLLYIIIIFNHFQIHISNKPELAVRKI